MSVAHAWEWTLGDRLRKARLHAGFEQEHMANAIGVSRVTISAWERDRSQPNLSQSVKWAEVTGVGLDWLAGLESTSARYSHAVLTGLPSLLDRRYRSDKNPPLLTVVPDDPAE